jgi:hypothetical protein
MSFSPSFMSYICGRHKMTTESQDLDLGNTYLYHQLDEYPWDGDREFQGGLQAILGSVQDPAQIEHLTLRAKCYYFARKAGTPVDFDGYKQWVETQRGTGPPNGMSAGPNVSGAVQPNPSSDDSGGGVGGMNDAPKPASFAEICEMIAEGKPIPGIKEIPDTILEGQASEKVVETRKKPWEKESEAQANPTWMS